jgi:hypothetical protein
MPRTQCYRARGSGESQANKEKFDERITRLAKWWGGKMLAAVSGVNCRAYTKHRGNDGGSRRDLEDLRAAINHHAKEGFHRGIVRVVLPEKGLPRERWLTRSEAARLLWTCWYRETQTVHIGKRKGQKIETKKWPLRHVARFILIGLYTGTRAGALAAIWATLEAMSSSSGFDYTLDRIERFEREVGRLKEEIRQSRDPGAVDAHNAGAAARGQ